MTRFMVFEPPAEETGGPRPTVGATDGAVFVRDAFSIWAFLFPPLWLLRHGLVLLALAAILLVGGLLYLLTTERAFIAVPLLLALGLIVALEGPAWRARRFLRRRWRDAGAVEASDPGEAAVLYFADHAAARTAAGRADRTSLPWAFAPAEVPKRRRWWHFGGNR